MRFPPGFRSAFAAFTIAVYSLWPAYADTLAGKVVGVADGDTVTLLVSVAGLNGREQARTQVRVRVSGIDAPERKQSFGRRAKQAMSDCAFGRQAHVQSAKKDRYGRVVGTVTVAGVDCGLELIRAGLAWHYKAYEREQPPHERTAYAAAEATARARGLGLWSQSRPQAPWDFRRQIRNER